MRGLAWRLVRYFVFVLAMLPWGVLYAWASREHWHPEIVSLVCLVGAPASAYFAWKRVSRSPVLQGLVDSLAERE